MALADLGMTDMETREMRAGDVRRHKGDGGVRGRWGCQGVADGAGGTSELHQRDWRVGESSVNARPRLLSKPPNCDGVCPTVNEGGGGGYWTVMMPFIGQP